MKLYKKIIITFFFLSFLNCNGQNSSDKVNASKYSIPKNLYILDSVSIKSNNKLFKIIVLEKKQVKKENPTHNSLEIVILEKIAKDKFILKTKNNNIVFKYEDNCPADGFISIVAKNLYFTIEQVYCKDFLFVNSYTTFKFDNKKSEFVLHKYGEVFTDRENPDKDIPTITKSTKDFGKILFNDVSQEIVTGLIK
jgi:hypothetical protein